MALSGHQRPIEEKNQEEEDTQTYQGVKLGELNVAADQALSGGSQLHGHGAAGEMRGKERRRE